MVLLPLCWGWMKDARSQCPLTSSPTDCWERLWQFVPTIQGSTDLGFLVQGLWEEHSCVLSPP